MKMIADEVGRNNSGHGYLYFLAGIIIGSAAVFLGLVFFFDFSEKDVHFSGEKDSDQNVQIEQTVKKVVVDQKNDAGREKESDNTGQVTIAKLKNQEKPVVQQQPVQPPQAGQPKVHRYGLESFTLEQRRELTQIQQELLELSRQGMAVDPGEVDLLLGRLQKFEDGNGLVGGYDLRAVRENLILAIEIQVVSKEIQSCSAQRTGQVCDGLINEKYRQLQELQQRLLDNNQKFYQKTVPAQ